MTQSLSSDGKEAWQAALSILNAVSFTEREKEIENLLNAALHYALLRGYRVIADDGEKKINMEGISSLLVAPPSSK